MQILQTDLHVLKHISITFTALSVSNKSVLLIGAPRERPVSMDLLLLQSHRSTTALYTSASSDQLTCNLTGPESEQHDHFDPEDEGLYERVGVCRAPPLSPPLNLDPNQVITENKQAAGGGVESKRLNEAGQGGVMAEYASVRKVRKLERGKRQEESEEENTSESSSSTVPRKAMEPFHIPSFPKVNTETKDHESISCKIIGLCL